MLAVNPHSKYESVLGANIIFWVLFLYFYLVMGIETVNGIALYKNINAVSALISAGKLFVVFVSLAFLSMASKKLAAAATSLVAGIMVVVWVHQVLGLDDDLRSVNIIFKIFNNLFFVFFAAYLATNFKSGMKHIRLALTVNYGVLIANIYIGALGIGFANYSSADDTAIGGTGFLPAGNEVGVALLLGYTSMLFAYKDSLIKTSLVILISVIAGVLVLSKSTLIGILLITVFFTYQLNKTLSILSSSLLVFAILSNLEKIVVFFQLAINRWTYLIRSFGWEPFVLGGHKRVAYITDYLSLIAENPLYLIGGVGWVGEAENNFFDLIEAFGVLGFIVFCIWGYVLLFRIIHLRKFNLTLRKDRALFKSAILCGFLVFVILVLAGHTVQSSLVAPFLAAFFVSTEKYRY